MASMAWAFTLRHGSGLNATEHDKVSGSARASRVSVGQSQVLQFPPYLQVAGRWQDALGYAPAAGVRLPTPRQWRPVLARKTPAGAKPARLPAIVRPGWLRSTRNRSPASAAPKPKPSAPNDCCRDWAMAWRRCKTATTSGGTRDAFSVPCGWAALDAGGMPCKYLSLNMPWLSGEKAMQPTPSASNAPSTPCSGSRRNRLYAGWWIRQGVPRSRSIATAARVRSGS